MNDERPNTPRGGEDLSPRLRQMALADSSTGRRLELPEDPETDGLLDAYRTGELATEERQRLETRLRREPALRRRLAERAGVRPELPEGLREQVLDSVAAERARPGKNHASRWLVAAALLFLGVATALLLPSRRLPPEVAYQVEVRGLAETRDPEAGSGPPEVSAGTVVRIVARPERTLSTAVAFGVYRPLPDELERVPEGILDVQQHGGAVTLSARAEELIQGEEDATTPYLTTLYLVVARPGDLPSSIPAEAGTRAGDRLAAGGRRRVYPFSIRWLPELPPGPPPEPSTPGGMTP